VHSFALILPECELEGANRSTAAPTWWFMPKTSYVVVENPSGAGEAGGLWPATLYVVVVFSLGRATTSAVLVYSMSAS
jgi:hypothetical protein